MRLVIVAGPPSAGKTAVIRQIIRKFVKTDTPAYLKIDVVKAFEDEELREEFGIPTRKVYSGDLCPDHMGIMVLRDAITWAEGIGAGMLIIESAGLCLRCTPVHGRRRLALLCSPQYPAATPRSKWRP